MPKWDRYFCTTGCLKHGSLTISTANSMGKISSLFGGKHTGCTSMLWPISCHCAALTHKLPMLITLSCARSQVFVGCSTMINTILCRCTSIQCSCPLMNKLLKPMLELCCCLLAFAFIQVGKSNSDIAWAATSSAWHYTHLVLLHKPAHNCFIILTTCSMPHTHFLHMLHCCLC